MDPSRKQTAIPALHRAPFSICAAVAFVAVSCTSTPTPTVHASSPTVMPSSGYGGPMLAGMVSISGQFVVTASFAVPVEVGAGAHQTAAPSGMTCGDYANGYSANSQAQSFDSPAAQTGGSPSVYVSVTLPTGYNGPGTYSARTSPALTGVATVAVTTAEGPSYYVFRSQGGDTTLSVAADGSGTVLLSNWPDTESRGGNGTGRITGTVSWMCR